MPLDFELTEEQKLMQQTAREWALKEFSPKLAAEYEKRGEFPWEVYRKCAKQGYIGMTWPPEYGGQGLGFFDAMVVSYELMKVEPTFGALPGAGTFGSDMIAEFGTHEQKSKWLPKLARGEITSSGAYTEPAGGSDISRVLDTRAERVGKEWVINGSKIFVGNSTTSSILLTLVQTDLKADPPYRGQTEFIVERGPGVEAVEFKNKMGSRLLLHGEIRYTNVRVTDDDILGGPANLNRGFYLGLMGLDRRRLEIGWHTAAIAETALERAISYSKEREAFGRKIGGFQGLAFRLVEMATQIELLKSLCYRGIWLMMKAKENPALRDESLKLASMAKWFGARTAVEALDLAIDVHAGYGYFESDLERWYRFAKGIEIGAGTKEIQKNLIARTLLGRDIVKPF